MSRPPVTPIAPLIYAACVLEAQARKPGNVHPERSFVDLTFEDFVRSAAAAAEALPRALAQGGGVGELVLAGCLRTRESLPRPTNTNLGILLLLAPLVAVPPDQTLAEGVEPVLAKLTVQDARAVYRAIALMQPGGLGQVDDADVANEPQIDLRAAMRLAEDRDWIAREYSRGYPILLQTALPLLASWPDFSEDWEQAIIHLQLTLMSRFPDTLIARKCGPEVARESADRAAAVLAAGGPRTEPGRQLLSQLDDWLRGDGHRRNPGTTADLIAASLFAAARDGMIGLPSGFVVSDLAFQDRLRDW